MPDDHVPVFPAPASLVAPRSVWRWYVALVAPFALCLLVLMAKGRTLPVYWGDSDEPLHWSLTRWFAARLPAFEPVYPDTATTPLFHLLGAFLVRLVGPSLTLARALNTAFSVAGVYALFTGLRRIFRHGPATAALLTSVFFTSAYFFGYSFRWLTDNLALTFCILALGQLFQFADPSKDNYLRSFLFGCMWYALAVLTRQSYVFLGLPFAVVLLTSGLPLRAIAAGMVGLALAVAPFAALVFVWHGLVPPDFQGRHAGSLINLYAVSLPLILVGFYVPFFEGIEFWRRLRSGSSVRLLWPLLAAVAGIVIVWKFPLAPVEGHPEWSPYFPENAYPKDSGYFGGWIYNVAGRLPRLHRNSVVFWVLLPVGMAATAGFLLDACRPSADVHRRVAVFFLAGLLLSSLLNRICAQKYYDGLVLLFLLWWVRGEAAKDPWRRAALVALILLFGTYFALYPLTLKAGGDPAVQKTTALWPGNGGVVKSISCLQ